ncbi:hypothetical protein, partial [Riemerella anatipestifer]
GENELKSDSFHSVFGFVGYCCHKLHMSKKEVLQSTFAELNMMLTDAPKVQYKKKEPKRLKNINELAEWLGAEEIETE